MTELEVKAGAYALDPARHPLIALPDIDSNLVVDFTFDYLKASLADAATVPAVASQAGSLALTIGDAAGSLAKPKLDYDGFGAHAALDFDGASAIRNNAATTVIANGQPSTIIALVQAGELAGTGGPFRVVSGATGNIRAVQVTTARYPRADAVTGNMTLQTALGTGRVALISTLDAAGNASLRIGDGVPITASGWTTNPLAGIVLGANTGGAASAAFVGKIGRVRIHNRVLTDTDISVLISSLRADNWLP